MIDLNPSYLAVVERILAEHVPECEVRAFGSRASWTAKDYSDLDLAIVGDGPLDWRTLALLKEAFEESDLPMRVDVLDWHNIAESFQHVIERHYVVLQEGSAKNSTNWREVTVDDLAEKVAMGPFGSSIKVETFVPEGIPVISGQHLHGSRVDDGPGFNFISRDHAQRLANANVTRGDIVLTHRGTIGQVAYIPEDSQFERYVVSQSQFYVRCDRSKAIPEFVTMYFRSPEGQHKLLANRSQVGVPSIAQPVSYLRTIEIPLPPLPEQRAIAHVLGTLDDKIELNRRMNETLEEMARALFRSWFVDFDPVRAKMAGEGPSLPPEVSALFPDRLVLSELGEIPEGWEVKALADCYDLTMGQSPPGSTYNDEGVGMPFFQGRTDFGFRYPENRKFCTAPARTAQPDDTLVSVRAPVGDINMAWEKSCIGRGVAALRHRSGSRSFTFYAAQAMQPVLREYEHTGTVFGAINKIQFESLHILEPDATVITAFEAHARLLDERIKSDVAESRALATERDALLPRLVSGEVRVGEVG